MSDMKHDALTSQGIEIVERVPIPDDLVPPDAHVEIAAKKAAGYYSPRAATATGPDQFGRPFAGKVLREDGRVGGKSRDIGRAVVVECQAVRERAHRMLAIGLDDKLPNFRIHLDRLDSAVDLVLQTTRKAYPSFEVPFHSRWRHFVAKGDNRWADIADHIRWPDRAARARAEFDLAIVSVFLDAGAGPSWRYHDPKTGSAIGRSEGLGLASLAMFADGAFSADPRDPLRVDAEVLANFSIADLERGLQVSDLNPLVGLTAALTCCGALARWWPRSRTSSAASIHQDPAGCSIDLRYWRTTCSFLPLRYSPGCCKNSDRSGRRG